MALFLQKHLADVTQKFVKWQRPVDFEPKMQNVKRSLDEIKDRLYLIELRSDDQQTIKDQLDHCMVSNDQQTIKDQLDHCMVSDDQQTIKDQLDHCMVSDD